MNMRRPRKPPRFRKGETRPPGKIYGYIRASTVDQESTLESQENAIKEVAARYLSRGFTAGEMYVDSGVSGGVPLSARPKGRELVLALQPGDAVVVTALDRLFRDAADLCHHVKRWSDSGVRLVIQQLDVDTGTPAGMAVLQMLGVIAQFERSIYRERMRMWWKNRQAKGAVTFGRYPPYGFKAVGEPGARRLEADPTQRKLGAKILAWHQEGWSLQDIVRHLAEQDVRNPQTGELFSKSSVHRTLVAEAAMQEEERGKEET